LGAVDRVRARHDIFGGLRKDLDSLLGATCLITFKTSVPLQYQALTYSSILTVDAKAVEHLFNGSLKLNYGIKAKE
jgi:hypothetical protein